MSHQEKIKVLKQFHFPYAAYTPCFAIRAWLKNMASTRGRRCRSTNAANRRAQSASARRCFLSANTNFLAACITSPTSTARAAITG